MRMCPAGRPGGIFVQAPVDACQAPAVGTAAVLSYRHSAGLLARVGERGLQVLVDRALRNAETTADTHRRKLPGVHQAIYRHPGHPHDLGDLRDREEAHLGKLWIAQRRHIGGTPARGYIVTGDSCVPRFVF